MNALPCRVWYTSVLALAFGLGLGLLAGGCDSNPKPRNNGQGAKTDGPTRDSYYHIDLPKTDPRPGTAVAILIDTSGSMARPVADVGGKQRPKNQIAHDALARIIEHTEKWKKDNPGSSLQVGIFTFSSGPAEVLPMGDFDAARARDALSRIPGPDGGTAIGRALEEAAKALYRSGCARKFVICITDGENTSGPGPDRVARQLFAQTEGGVAMEFVAFNTSAAHFRFLKEVKGNAVEASSGEQLQTELNKIYRQKVLAEAPEPPK